MLANSKRREKTKPTNPPRAHLGTGKQRAAQGRRETDFYKNLPVGFWRILSGTSGGGGAGTQEALGGTTEPSSPAEFPGIPGEEALEQITHRNVGPRPGWVGFGAAWDSGNVPAQGRGGTGGNLENPSQTIPRLSNWSSNLGILSCSEQ